MSGEEPPRAPSADELGLLLRWADGIIRFPNHDTAHIAKAAMACVDWVTWMLTPADERAPASNERQPGTSEVG